MGSEDNEGERVTDDLTTAYLLGAEAMRDKLHKQSDEIDRLKREAAIRIDQLRREQDAHLRTIADYNRARVETEKLREENQRIRQAIKDYLPALSRATNEMLRETWATESGDE